MGRKVGVGAEQGAAVGVSIAVLGGTLSTPPRIELLSFIRKMYAIIIQNLLTEAIATYYYEFNRMTLHAAHPELVPLTRPQKYGQAYVRPGPFTRQ